MYSERDSYSIVNVTLFKASARDHPHPNHELGFASTYCCAVVVVLFIPSADMHL